MNSLLALCILIAFTGTTTSSYAADWPAPMVSGIYNDAMVSVRGDTVEMVIDKDSAAAEPRPYLAAGIWNGKDFDMTVFSMRHGVRSGKLKALSDGTLLLTGLGAEKTFRVVFFHPFVRVGVTRRTMVHRDEDWGDQEITEGRPVGLFDEIPKPGCDWCRNTVEPARGLFFNKQTGFVALGHGARRGAYDQDNIELMSPKQYPKSKLQQHPRRMIANRLVEGEYLQNLRVVQNPVGDGWSILRIHDWSEAPGIDEQLLVVRPDGSLAAKAVWFPENAFAKRIPGPVSDLGCEDPSFAKGMTRWIDSMLSVGLLPGADRGKRRKGLKPKTWGNVASIRTTGSIPGGYLCEASFVLRSSHAKAIRMDTLETAFLLRKHEGRMRPAIPFIPFAERIDSLANGKRIGLE